MDFSERLLTLRKSLDLTQEQLAEKLNVSRQRKRDTSTFMQYF